TTITATMGAVSGSTALTVTSLANLASIVVMPTNPSVVVGATENFTATGTFSDGSHQDVTTQASWSSDTTSVATIGPPSDPQPVNAVDSGTSTITATISAVSGSTLLTVEKSTLSIKVTPRHASVVVGTQKQQFSAKVSGDPSDRGATWSVDGTAGGSA